MSNQTYTSPHCKVLVCITIQNNSKRLIQKGLEISSLSDGELHILHVRKGDTIFDTPESSNLLHHLFEFGSTLGGSVHFLCSDEVPLTISQFIKDEQITHLVIGESPFQATESSNFSNSHTDSEALESYNNSEQPIDLAAYLTSCYPNLEIIILPRSLQDNVDL